VPIYIIYNCKKYKKSIQRSISFLNKIHKLCIQLSSSSELDIAIYLCSNHFLHRLGKRHHDIIIKDRATKQKYLSVHDINYPTILSFVLSDNYAEIYISIQNILFKHQIPYKCSHKQILTYLVHSICNVYDIKIYLYDFMLLCIMKQNNILT
jgi:hypothetical protein